MAQVLNGVGIVVADMARSLDFYRRLGLDVPETPHEGHVDIALPNGFRLMLDSEAEMRTFMPGWVRQHGNLFSLAFQCDSPSEVDAVYGEIVGAGYCGDKEPWDAFWGQRYAKLLDPDGVPVDLYATLEM
ncbi:MAG: VOC family protein [Chloroflexi bacterium]|nr:VOC family protein [Chloroflexota bacterium]